MADDGGKPTTASDVYALGCIALEFLFLQVSYHARKSNRTGLIFQDIKGGIPPAIRPANLSEDLEHVWQILENSWILDPARRIEAQQMLALFKPHELRDSNIQNVIDQMKPDESSHMRPNSTHGVFSSPTRWSNPMGLLLYTNSTTPTISANDPGHYNRMIKVIMVGDGAVGKSSLLLRLLHDKFDACLNATIGVAFATIYFHVNRKTFKVQIVDTAAQERFKSIVSSCYRDAAGVIIVYDITQRSSFDNSRRWLKEANDNANLNSVNMLIANKSDLEQRRVVSSSEAAAFAKENGMLFAETSARKKSGITASFLQILEVISRPLNNEPYTSGIPPSSRILRNYFGEYDRLFEFVLIGDSGVGKSNILSRLAKDEFDLESKSTTSVNIAAITATFEGRIFKAHIWDTAGREGYRSLTSACHRRTAGVLLIYDIAKYSTYLNLGRWLNEIKDHVDQTCKIMLVGNKSDLKHLRAVPTAHASLLAKDQGASFFEVSARNAENLYAAFFKLLSAYVSSILGLLPKCSA